MKKIKTYFLVSFLLFFWACVSTNVDTEKHYKRKTNYASLYNPGSANINPKVRAYHASQNETFLFFAVNLDNMMPVPGNDKKQGGGLELGLKYAIRNAETREIADSATYYYSFEPDERGVFVNYVASKLKNDNHYFASVIFIDQVKKSHKRIILNIDKENKGSKGYYFPEYLEPERSPVLDNFISGTRKMRITSDMINQDSIFRLRFPGDTILPAPPYKTNSGKSSETDSMIVNYYHLGDTMTVDTAGYYFFTTDTASGNGLGLYKGSEFFPWIKQPGDMVNPVRYVSTKKQYENILEAENTKLAVDKFWYDLAGTKDRAKELIRVYYNRVQLANHFFTTEKPGWQTDRGMVYVVLGAPHEVYKDGGKEKWVYGASESHQGLVFNFIHDSSTLSNNAYLLMRDQRYKETWMNAVKSWKKGHPYSVPE
ncbi:MAG: GWxTD domain-containing protein [Bacteroidales bacterium]